MDPQSSSDWYVTSQLIGVDNGHESVLMKAAPPCRDVFPCGVRCPHIDGLAPAAPGPVGRSAPSSSR